MAISASDVTRLNKMNRASQRASLGTAFLAAQSAITALEIGSVITGGSTSVTTAQSNASAVILNTGLGTSYGQVVQQLRSGSLIHYASGSVLKVVNSSGSITLTGMSANIIVTGDVIHFVAF